MQFLSLEADVKRKFIPKEPWNNYPNRPYENKPVRRPADQWQVETRPESADPVKEAVLKLWADVRGIWRAVPAKVADYFKHHKSLTKENRGRIVECLHGMIRQQRRLEFALDGAGVKWPQGDERDQALYLAYRVLSGSLALEVAEKAIPEIDWSAVSLVHEAIAEEADPIRRFGLEYSYPDLLAKRLMEDFPSDAAELAKALNQSAPFCLRVNSLKTTRDALIASLKEQEIEAEPIASSTLGLRVPAGAPVYVTQEFQDGHFEVQDEGSQIVAELVAASPGSVVLDFCAGAGGKALALGASMNNKGLLFATDPQERPLEELRRRARRAGMHNVRAVCMEDEIVPPEITALKNKCARVLADVPCSGLGAFRRNPEARWRMEEEDLSRLPEEQFQIARKALEFVKPGGRLIYATCTVLKAENEDVVQRLLSMPESEGFVLQLVPLKEILGKERVAKLTDASGNYLKLLPHVQGTDGFFAAVMRRK